MEEKEIREDFWYFYKGKPFKVNAHAMLELYYSSEIKHYKPIPLTEEHLLQFGFKEKYPSVFVNGIYDLERLTQDSPRWEFCINEEQTGTTIEYVHQLQILYYALTSRQLELE